MKFSRTRLLVGDDGFKMLSSLNIGIFGLGGVGVRGRLVPAGEGEGGNSKGRTGGDDHQ